MATSTTKLTHKNGLARSFGSLISLVLYKCASRRTAQEVAELSASSSQMSMVEGLVDDLHKRLEDRESDLEQMKSKLKTTISENVENKSKFKKAESDLRIMADENDILNTKKEELGRAEITIGKYKKKLEEATALKAHMGEVEAQSSKFLDQILGLEEKVKLMGGLQRKFDELREKSGNSDKALFELESKFEVSENENRRIKSELEAANGARKMFEDELKEAKSVASVGSVGGGGEDIVGGDMDVDLSYNGGGKQVLELKEKLARLERENVALRESGSWSGSGDSGEAVREAKARCNMLEKQVKRMGDEHRKEINGKVEEQEKQGKAAANLEQLLNKTQTALAESSDVSEASEATSKENLKVLEEKLKVASCTCEQLELEIKKLNERDLLSKEFGEEQKSTILNLASSVDDLNAMVKEKTSKIDEISNNLLVSEKNKLKLTGDRASLEANVTKLTSICGNQKGTIEKLSADKTKLELYAKQSLHKFQNKFLVALQGLKQKLKEKSERIELLESEKIVQKREEKLLSSSIFELGLQIIQSNKEKGV